MEELCRHVKNLGIFIGKPSGEHLRLGENQDVAQAAQERHLVVFGGTSGFRAGVNFRDCEPDDRRSKR